MHNHPCYRMSEEPLHEWCNWIGPRVRVKLNLRIVIKVSVALPMLQALTAMNLTLHNSPFADMTRQRIEK
jgi:hypothetical protein